MEDDMTCAICLDIATEAVETECCHHIYCLECVESLGQCPTCRLVLSYKPSIIIRRMIGKMPLNCPNAGCKVTTTRSNLSDHKECCEFEQHSCPGPECNYKGLKGDFCQHIADKHSRALLKNAKRLFSAALDEAEKREQQQQQQPMEEQDDEEDCMKSRRNAFGRQARLGFSGKYYCGGELDGPACLCCNGYCGPTSGCNCSACMQLDVQARKLPKGWYVNSDGCPCRRGKQTGTFYCGRKVIRHRDCDGYCGPTDGPNCKACRILMSQLLRRYATVW